MKSRFPSRQGAALVACLLLIGVLLGLVLLYVSLVQVEKLVTHVEGTRTQVDLALDRTFAEAMQTIADSYNSSSNRVYAMADQVTDWYSRGGGGIATGQVTHLPDTRDWQAEWQVHGATNRPYLATAWAAFDLTGLLDPNVVGREVRDLASSTNAMAIQTDWLTADLASAPPEAWRTTREFAAAHTNAWPVFLPGSFSADRGWYNPTNRVWVTNDLDLTLWDEDQVRSAMSLLYPSNDVDDLTHAFLDFVDGDAVPTDPLALCSEPVPMFNEALGVLVVSNDGVQVTVDVRVQIEVWYPSIANPATNRFRVSDTLEFASRHADSDALTFGSLTATNNLEFSVPTGSMISNAFEGVDLVYQSVNQVTTGDVVAVDVNLGQVALARDDGPLVDRFPSNLVLSLPDVTVPASGQVAVVEVDLEVTDPRLNHRLAEWGQAGTNSLGRINAAAYASASADGLRDPFVTWSPADQTNTWRAAWIGFLPLDDPWRSVDLFASDGHWWLAHSRDRGFEPGIWRRGLMNPNGAYTTAVAAVFVDTPVETWPGDGGGGQVAINTATLMADDIRVALDAGTGTVHRAEWTAAVEDGLLLADEIDGDRHRAESVIRNSMDLFNPAQQVWGLVLRAVWRVPGGRVLTGGEVLAIVWWDPYADENGMHAWELIRWLPR